MTAWARWYLQQGIDAAGRDFVYCDTDSVKYRHGDPEVERRLEELNDERRILSMQYGAWANDPKGEAHYMGVFESEGIYQEFRTLGAKKYVYRYPDGPLKCTIAGVNKKLGGPELEKYGGIDAFREGFTFVEAGGTESIYNDIIGSPIIVEREGHELAITSNVVIAESTYTVGLTTEYKHILDDAKNILNMLHKHGII